MQKYVLVTIDGREMTASRKKDAVDLVTLWQQKTNMPYQLAIYPLDVGDVWISVSDAPISIPEKYRFNRAQAGPPEDLFAVAPTRPTQHMEEETVEVAFPPHPTLVIERKALADLQSSYSDGRYKDQKTRLINCDADMVILLVEGYAGAKVKDATAKKRLLSTFTHSMFRDNIPVYQTTGIRDSFEWLEWTANEMALGKLERTADYMQRTKYTDNIQMTKKANLTPERGLELQLASIPGISAKMARAVCEEYPSMMHLCRAYEATAEGNARSNLLANLVFRGPSGKEQRLATRSGKIYQYICGVSGEKVKAPAKKKLKL